MKPVVQLERTGCGIACAATIAEVSYSAARKIAADMDISASDPALWSDTTNVRALLAALGFKACNGETPFRDWGKLPDLALLAIKWHLENGKPYWHWVVFVRENGVAFVLDPKRGLHSNRRTDFGRMKPKWFVPVERD